MAGTGMEGVEVDGAVARISWVDRLLLLGPAFAISAPASRNSMHTRRSAVDGSLIISSLLSPIQKSRPLCNKCLQRFHASRDIVCWN